MARLGATESSRLIENNSVTGCDWMRLGATGSTQSTNRNNGVTGRDKARGYSLPHKSPAQCPSTAMYICIVALLDRGPGEISRSSDVSFS